jgi:SPP1 gp7 family putative phage head morphogenesis protein
MTNVKTPIDKNFADRLAGAWNVLTGKASTAQVDDGGAWFGPLNPPTPTVTGEAQVASVTGRQFDFPTGYNLRQRPRSGDAVTFDQMRALADNCDILRLVIETRKDQLSKMKFHIKPIEEEDKVDDRCKEVESFFKLPDGENSWNDWLRQLLEEQLVTDAATIYPRMTNAGKPYRMELMDGTTIKRVLDHRGRTPDAPLPAYQQVLKGMTAVDYTADELIYAPRNKRVSKVYGYSPVEQIIMTVNIAIRRQLHQLQYYTEGSRPDLLFQVPADWNNEAITAFNEWWATTLSGDTASRRKGQFVPNGVTPINLKEDILKDAYDEWLARIVCYCFSVPPTPFVAQMNKATAQTAQDAALEEGLFPIMLWIKGTMDKIIWKYFGYTDLEFGWQDQEATNPKDQNAMDDVNVKNGTATLNEVRLKRGDKSLGPLGDKPMVLTGQGYVLITGAPPVVAPPVMQNSPTEGGNNPAPTEPTAKDETEEPAPAEPEPGTTKIAKAASNVTTIDRSQQEPIINDTASKLKKQFKKLADAVASHVVNKVGKDAGNIIDPFADFTWTGWSDVQDLFGTQLVAAGTLGATQAYAQINLDDPSTLDLANADAIQYSKERSAELVGKRIKADGTVIDNPNPIYSMEDATREMLRADVTAAMEQGLSNDKLASILKENYAFSDERAETIARTETALADCNGNLVLYRRSEQVDSKKWIVGADCCDECAALDGEVVGLEEKFSNGTEAPPAHPNCRCDFIPVLNEDKGGEDA